jgi:hypothetical protein
VIDPAVGNPTEQQVRLGFAGAVDAGPAVVWIGAPQVGQFIVDGVGVHVDESYAGGRLSVDDGGSAQHVGRQCLLEGSYYGCTIQDVYA